MATKQATLGEVVGTGKADSNVPTCPYCGGPARPHLPKHLREKCEAKP